MQQKLQAARERGEALAAQLSAAYDEAAARGEEARREREGREAAERQLEELRQQLEQERQAAAAASAAAAAGAAREPERDAAAAQQAAAQQQRAQQLEVLQGELAALREQLEGERGEKAALAARVCELEAAVAAAAAEKEAAAAKSRGDLKVSQTALQRWVVQCFARSAARSAPCAQYSDFSVALSAWGAGHSPTQDCRRSGTLWLIP